MKHLYSCSSGTGGYVGTRADPCAGGLQHAWEELKPGKQQRAALFLDVLFYVLRAV